MSAYPAGGAFYGTHAEQYDNVYSNDDLAGKGNYDADAWGTTPGTMSASSSGDARDRWLARKEAAAATMGEKGEYTYGKGAGAAPRKNRIWLWTGLIVGAVIIAAVVVGVVIALKNKNSTPSSKPAGVVKSDPKDPSNFDKDPNLHNSFYGMCYTPLK